MLVTSLARMNTISREYAHTLRVHREKATVVTFSGDLGAGKTTFIQGMLRALGVTESVTSPTFVIQKIYPLTGQAFSQVVHVDAYRLQSVRELEVLGWEALMANPHALVLVEWPEKIAEAIPPHATQVTLKYVDETVRELTI